MKWIRPVNSREMFYHAGQQQQTLIVCYRLTLKTKREITEEVFKTSLIYLKKKVASFRLSIQREEVSGLLWFVESGEPNIDYEVITKGYKHETEMLRLAHKSFVESGLLWRSSLMKNVCDTIEASKEDLKEIGYFSNIFFGLHHAISDGTANIKICNLFIRILDDVLGGKQIDNNQLGNFEFRTESDEIFSECRQKLLLDPELEKKKKEMLHAFLTKTPLWTEAFTINKFAEDKTIHIERELEADATLDLIKCFKSKGISVTSGFCSILNVLMAGILNMNGVKRENYEIGTLLGVNLRQYWKNIETFPLGYHIEFLRNYFETPHNVKEDFWTYASNIHETIRNQVESKHCVNTEILRKLLFPDFNEEQLNRFFKKEHSLVFYYCFSSLGNIDSTTGENVDWTGFSRTVSTHKLENTLAINFQTFRKKFQFSFEYVPKYISEEVAEYLADKLCDILTQISFKPPSEMFILS